MDLSIPSLLNNLGDEGILLKRDHDFPSFLPGKDFDILVMDRFRALGVIQKYLDPLLDRKEYFLRVNEGARHIHLDIMHGKDLWVRFDLIDSLDVYFRFSVQESLKVKFFLNREMIKIDDQAIYVPSLECDLLIRYFEYLEYFETRPDKIKHLDFIFANSTEEQKAELINNAHRYISFHHMRWTGEVPSQTNFYKSRKQAIREIFQLFKRVIHTTWDSFKLKS